MKRHPYLTLTVVLGAMCLGCEDGDVWSAYDAEFIGRVVECDCEREDGTPRRYVARRFYFCATCTHYDGETPGLFWRFRPSGRAGYVRHFASEEHQEAFSEEQRRLNDPEVTDA